MTDTSRFDCPILRATNVIGDQWSILILREFFLEGPRRFQDLQEVLGVSPNTLSSRLKKLESAGIITRKQYSTNPPRSDYRLTDKGKTLAPVIMALRKWGEAQAQDLT